MFDLKCRLYRIGPKFPHNVNVFDTPRYVQGFMKFLQYKVTKLVAVVLFWLIAPRYPHVAPCKLTQANQSPLHFVMLCGHAHDLFIDERVQGLLACRNMY